MLVKLIELIFRFGALIFGIGFMAPLIAELIRLSGVTVPLGLSPLVAGLVLGGLFGLVAQLRGSWVWQK